MPSPFLHFGLIVFSNRRKAFSGFNQFAVIVSVRTMPTNISAACSSQVFSGGNTLEPFGGSNLLTKQQIASSGLSVCDIAQSIFIRGDFISPVAAFNSILLLPSHLTYRHRPVFDAPILLPVQHITGGDYI